MCLAMLSKCRARRPLMIGRYPDGGPCLLLHDGPVDDWATKTFVPCHQVVLYMPLRSWPLSYMNLTRSNCYDAGALKGKG